MSEPENITIRQAKDSDAPGLIALIGKIFEDYDCVLDLEHLDSDLLAIETAMASQGGEFFVAEARGRIIGCIGYVLKGKGGEVVELKRLYVAPKFRRQGLASRLSGLVYQAAEDNNAEAIELWSDTRFREAHDFYLKHGFEKRPETRKLNDPSDTTEYHFVKRL